MLFVSPQIYFVSPHIFFASRQIYFISPQIYFVSSHIYVASRQIYFVSPQIYFISGSILFSAPDIFVGTPIFISVISRGLIIDISNFETSRRYGRTSKKLFFQGLFLREYTYVFSKVLWYTYFHANFTTTLPYGLETKEHWIWYKWSPTRNNNFFERVIRLLIKN